VNEIVIAQFAQSEPTGRKLKYLSSNVKDGVFTQILDKNEKGSSKVKQSLRFSMSIFTQKISWRYGLGLPKTKTIE
jgi:hypothetical protein